MMFEEFAYRIFGYPECLQTQILRFVEVAFLPFFLVITYLFPLSEIPPVQMVAVHFPRFIHPTIPVGLNVLFHQIKIAFPYRGTLIRPICKIHLVSVVPTISILGIFGGGRVISIGFRNVAVLSTIIVALHSNSSSS